jgi:hypothetical protein
MTDRGQQPTGGRCIEAGQCQLDRDWDPECPLFRFCAKTRALADDRAYEDYMTTKYL